MHKVPKKANKKKTTKKKTRRRIRQKNLKIINILFVCQEGALRSPRNAKDFLEYVRSKNIGQRFHVSHSGSKPKSISYMSKLLTADIVIAFSPAIASKARELVKDSKMKPEVIVFGKIGGSAAKSNYLRLSERALDKFGR